MIILGTIFATLTLLVVGLLIRPLLRSTKPAPTRLDYDLHVYRQQLDELERDQERGVLGLDQRHAAEIEIHRRMLAAAQQPDPAPARTKRHKILAASLLLALPAAAASLYLMLGHPTLPDRPFAERQSDPAFQMASLADQLAQRLALAPDGEGFHRLGDAYMLLQRYQDAAEAFQRAIALGVSDPTMLSGFGEALAMLNDGMVIPEARKLFQQALVGDADNPQARFYLGLAEAQIGQYTKAVAIWRDLERSSAKGAPWLPTLRQHILDAAKQGGFDPDGVAPAPASPAAAAIAAQSPSDQAKTIRAMVDGLAARLQQQPDDFDGWMRLALSYKVLGETDKSKDAARHAIALRPQAVEPRLALAQTELGKAGEDALPADFLVTLQGVLTLDAANPTALYYLGVAAAAAGRSAEARRLLEKLLQTMPAEMPERAEISRRLAALPR